MSYQKGNINRDGTSQLQRFLKALDPSSAPIEDRGMEDWLKFIKSIASEINYYNFNDQKEGHWGSFFPADADVSTLVSNLNTTTNLPPHQALVLAFLHLLNYVKADLNLITQKHLNYYYKDILKFEAQTPVPDQVHLFMELNKNASKVRLPAGTQLKASAKDALGKDLIYKTNREIIVNKSSIDSIRTVLVDYDDQHKIYAAPFANSSDGLGTALDDPDYGWNTFGESQIGKAESERTMLDAEIGLGIASPILLLEEGTRNIIITLNLLSYKLTTSNLQALLTNLTALNSEVIGYLVDIENQQFDSEESLRAAVDQALDTLSIPALKDDLVDQVMEESGQPIRHLDNDDLENALKIYASGNESWFQIETVNISKIEPDQLLISLLVPADAPPIINHSAKLHGDKINANTPVIQLLLNEEASNYRYDELRALQISEINIEVSVSGIKNLILANDNGPIDPSQAFLPFGAIPSQGSSFYFGNTEVFNKKLDNLDIELKWADLPIDNLGFSDYYSVLYPAVLGTISNASFNASFGILQNFEWLSNTGSSIQLFETDTDSGGGGAPLLREAFSRTLSIPATADRSPENKVVDHYGVDVINGFGRLTLNAPSFGHQQFAKLYGDRAVEIAATGVPDVLPNPPYTPKLNSVALSYKSSVSISLEDLSTYDSILHIEPFGSLPIESSETPHLIPQLPKGTLYLGINEVSTPQSLSLLFRLVEGSANPDIAVESNDIKWAYLSNNQWISLDSESIQIDTTKGLQTSGIIDFALGRNASNDDTRQTGNLHWLKASFDKDPSGIGRIINIHPQAVTATFLNQGNDLSHLINHLEAGSISKFVTKVAGIKSVNQPYISFGGKTTEQQESLQNRVSERLRHKQRGINIWDFERLTLQAFPDIYKAKCLRHSSESSELVPGEIDLIVIPNLRNQNAANPLEPKVSSIIRNNIKDYISQYTSLFTTINVQNPKYEPLLVEMKVGLREGFDGGYYGNLLNEELKKFLSPWAFEEGEDIIFGGKVYKSSILAFVEKRAYVDYVTDFKLYHLNQGASIGEMCVEIDFTVRPDAIGDEVDFAEASTARSILVSASKHSITVLDPGEYVCSGGALATGIGSMTIGIDFISG